MPLTSLALAVAFVSDGKDENRLLDETMFNL